MSKSQFVVHQDMNLFGASIKAGTYVRQKEWVELTPEEGAEIWADCHDINWNRLVTPKEIVQRISDKLKEKNHAI